MPPVPSGNASCGGRDRSNLDCRPSHLSVRVRADFYDEQSLKPAWFAVRYYQQAQSRQQAIMVMAHRRIVQMSGIHSHLTGPTVLEPAVLIEMSKAFVEA